MQKGIAKGFCRPSISFGQIRQCSGANLKRVQGTERASRSCCDYYAAFSYSFMLFDLNVKLLNGSRFCGLENITQSMNCSGGTAFDSRANPGPHFEFCRVHTLRFAKSRFNLTVKFGLENFVVDE